VERNFSLYLHGPGVVRFEWTDGKTVAPLTAPSRLLNGTWKHIAVVANSTARHAAMYIDGQLAAEMPMPVPITKTVFKERSTGWFNNVLQVTGTPTDLLVRAILGLVYNVYPSAPMIQPFGAHTWQRLSKHTLPNTNMVESPTVDTPEHRDWLAQGKLWLANVQAPGLLDDKAWTEEMLLDLRLHPGKSTAWAERPGLDLAELSGMQVDGSANRCPQADFRVHLDVQMHVLATDPAFFGLWGVQPYRSNYVDEEILDCMGRLLRHYCVEGRTARMLADPYELKHVADPDFEQGLARWQAVPAEAGSVGAGKFAGYGNLQGRYPNSSIGDTFAVMTRSAKTPNTLRQELQGLKAGAVYSLTGPNRRPGGPAGQQIMLNFVELQPVLTD